MDRNFKVGIVDYTLYTPEQTITAQELSPLVNIPAEVLRDKMGINKKHVGAPDDQPGIMAKKCVKELLAKTGFDANDIDMILYAGETYSEYICWTVGVSIQHEIGADRAYAWDLAFRCAGLPLGMKVAKEMMYADEGLKNVLLCGGNNNCSLVDYKDPLQSFMFNMSPGAFAMLLRRDYDRNQILDSGIFTDHQFADDVIGLTGGSLTPLTQEMVEAMVQDPEKTRRFSLLSLPDGEDMKRRLGQASLPDFSHTVRLACKRCGIEPADLDFIGVVHIGHRAHYALMDELGIAREKTVFLYDDGHCGHADPLISLNYGIEQGIVKDGALCALVGAGTGYVFGCTIVRWGKDTD